MMSTARCIVGRPYPAYNKQNSFKLTLSGLSLPLSFSSTTSCRNSRLVVDEDDLK